MGTLCLMGVSAQTDASKPFIGPPAPEQRYTRRAITAMFGPVYPVSRDGLREFWLQGPGGSLRFAVNVSRPMALGVGFDAAVFFFGRGAFGLKYPGVPLQARDIAFLNVYIISTYSFFPGKRLNPYVEANIGVSRLTEATYKQIVQDVRMIYYEIPGRARLTFALGGGVDVSVLRWMSFRAEANAAYILNDPDAGLVFSLRGGPRFPL